MKMQIRAAVIRSGERSFSIEDCELDTQPREREVRLRLLACGLCHTDLAARDQHLRVPLPAVLGHEGVGVIEALGPGVEGFAIGQRVLAGFGACGQCPSCTAHAPAYCRHLARFCLQGRRLDGSSPISAGAGRYLGETLTGHFFGQSSFATHTLVATANLVAMPDDLPVELLAPLACGVQTGMSAVVNVLEPAPGATLAVFGCGGVGLAAVMAARILECDQILAVDRVPERLALARELGATATATDIESAAVAVANWRGLSHALDTTGAPSIIESAFNQLLRPHGKLVCAGVGQPDAVLNFNHNQLMLSGKTLRGTIEGDADPRSFVPRMLDWMRQGRLPLQRLVRRYAFEDINQAVADMESGLVVKPVLIFED